MKKIELKARKLLRYLFGCVSFTAVAFVFQACYGTRDDDFYDVKLTGEVRSKTTNLPIKGIKVVLPYNKSYNFGITDEEGKFDFYASVSLYDFYDHYEKIDSISYMRYRYPSDSIPVHFVDIDGLENGYFEDKTVIINPAHKDEIKIYVVLEDKE
jgi:hypothetical protein